MKQLKEVIARKRPRPSDAIGDPAAADDTVADFRAIASEKRRETAQAAVDATVAAPEAPDATRSHPQGQPSRKPQIWDIDEATEPQQARERKQDQTRRGKEAPDGAHVRARRRPADPKASDPSSGGRAKTRILGFHAGDLETDVFSARAAEPGAASMYPAGWMVVVQGPGRGASFPVKAGVSSIGRGTDQTISLDFGDSSVSREGHASVAYDDEQNKFFVGHGGKSNIVRRNGNPVLSTEELIDGDLIRIGKTTLRFVALCGADFTWNETGEGQDSDAPAD